MKKKVTKIVRLKNFPLLFPAKRDVKSFRVGRNIFFFPSLFFLFFYLSFYDRWTSRNRRRTNSRHEFVTVEEGAWQFRC